MARFKAPRKQPDERLDYEIDYSRYFRDDDAVISAVVVGATEGITVEDISNTNTRSKFWVEGGDDGEEYVIKILATTSFGRKLEDDVIIPVKELG